MEINTNTIFSYFRKPSAIEQQKQLVETFFFQIKMDEKGAYIETIDKKGQPVRINSSGYQGAHRMLLKSIEEIKDRNNYIIDWENPSQNVYLHENEYLFDLLQRVKNIVDAETKPLHFKAEPAQVILTLQKMDLDRIESSIELKTSNHKTKDFQILSSKYVLSGEHILAIPNLGQSFNSLQLFNTVFKLKDIHLILSLLFSNIENIELVYEDYQTQITDVHIGTQPCLIFEKIDEDDALLLRVGQSLPNLEFQLMQEFDLSRYAEINEMEQEILIKNIEKESIEVMLDTIQKMLKKRSPSKKEFPDTEVMQEGNLFIIPKEIVSGFIYEDLPGLLLNYQIYGAEKLKSYKISTTQPNLKMNLNHGIDFLEGDVSLDFGSESINLFDVINSYKKNRYIKLTDGTHALLSEEYLKKLERIFNKKGKKAQVSFFDLPLVEDIIQEKVNHKSFAKSRDFYEGLNQIKKQKSKLPTLNAKLRPYQNEGYRWLQYLNSHGMGGCLADDMGLGKTLQTIALIAKEYQKKQPPSLIIMPKSLLLNWEREIKRFAPQITTSFFYGQNRDIQACLETNLVLTTYAVVRNDIESLKDIPFHYIILDESQNIKNIDAQATKAVMLLNSAYRLALSGTPIENNLGELYALFRFLNPSMFGPISQFNQNYLTPIQKWGDATAIQQLKKKIYPFILRRLKKDVLKELPDKIEQMLFIEMTEKQKQLYEKRRQFYKAAIEQQIAEKGLQQSQFFVFQALNELRQIASVPEHISEGEVDSPKLELLIEHLLDVIANGHKALIFVNYLAAIESISEKLKEAGINFVSMSGATRNRQALVDEFQNDKSCKVFLMTLKTGGTGLNLTAADTIFIFDPWWNVAAEQQAIDRSHRIGQTQKVIAYKLIVQNTIEEKILELQTVKKQLFDNIITTDGAGIKSFSEEDINFILA